MSAKRGLADLVSAAAPAAAATAVGGGVGATPASQERPAGPPPLLLIPSPPPPPLPAPLPRALHMGFGSFSAAAAGPLLRDAAGSSSGVGETDFENLIDDAAAPSSSSIVSGDKSGVALLLFPDVQDGTPIARQPLKASTFFFGVKEEAKEESKEKDEYGESYSDTNVHEDVAGKSAGNATVKEAAAVMNVKGKEKEVIESVGDAAVKEADAVIDVKGKGKEAMETETFVPLASTSGVTSGRFDVVAGPTLGDGDVDAQVTIQQGTKGDDYEEILVEIPLNTAEEVNLPDHRIIQVLEEMVGNLQKREAGIMDLCSGMSFDSD